MGMRDLRWLRGVARPSGERDASRRAAVGLLKERILSAYFVAYRTCRGVCSNAPLAVFEEHDEERSEFKAGRSSLYALYPLKQRGPSSRI